MKSVVQPSSKPYPTQSATDTTAMAPLTNSQPISGIGSSTGNASGGVYQYPVAPGISPAYPPAYPSSVPQNTFLTPGPSTHPYPPQYSLSPGVPPPWRDAYLQSVRGASPLPGPFAPKTAAELGLLDRPDTSYEGMEMSNIVDRMSSAFPLDVHSGNFFFVHIIIVCSYFFVFQFIQPACKDIQFCGVRVGLRGECEHVASACRAPVERMLSCTRVSSACVERVSSTC